jgi:hypothetical protein
MGAFPRRPLEIKAGRQKIGARILWLAATLMLAVMTVWNGTRAVQTLRSDVAIRDTARPAPHVRITEFRCRGVILFVRCELTLTWDDRGSEQASHLNYFFFEPRNPFLNPIVSASPMMDPARPELVTTDLGLHRIGNRAASEIFITLLLLLSTVGLIIRAVKPGNFDVDAMSGRALEPVALQFRGWGRGPTWRVTNAKGKLFKWPVLKTDQPFFLDPEHNLVLGLRDPVFGGVFPLDADLRFVELTPEERTRILEAARQGA